MNDADLLLHWLSELGVVTAKRLKETCVALAEPAEKKTRRSGSLLPQRLCRAGHAERCGDGGLLVAPSVMLHSTDGSRLLFGARDNEMLRDAEECNVVLERVAQEYEPEIWRCAGSDQQLATFAEQRQIVITNLDSLAILKSIPPIRSALVDAEEVAVPSCPLQFWHGIPSSKEKWRSGDECNEEGLYQTVEPGRKAFYYWDGKVTLRTLPIPGQREAAGWLSGQRRHRLHYSAQFDRLGITYPGPLPILVERCLRCGMGSEPTYELNSHKRDTRWYSGIPQQWAIEVARILECHLQK